MKNAPEAAREKLILWLNTNASIDDCNRFFNPCARKFEWFCDDQLREIANYIINKWRFHMKVCRQNRQRIAAQ